LNGHRKIETPKERRKGNGKFIELKGVRGNNLQNVDVKFLLENLLLLQGSVAVVNRH
jgi:excinuclease ABC subunit A